MLVCNEQKMSDVRALNALLLIKYIVGSYEILLALDYYSDVLRIEAVHLLSCTIACEFIYAMAKEYLFCVGC